ncbi:MAG: ABC transporter ATP-binding protein/permease [Lachnospiraceae bacterium]|nr:ABC transporter ATP-binding protein/permease [Lachnospiraceae bacterium]
MQLPSNFYHAVQKYGVSEKDIIFSATADFDMDYRFADTVAALTEKKLILAAWPHRPASEYKLGGYSAWQAPLSSSEPGVLLYDLSQVQKLEVQRLVSTGLLIGEINGLSQKLCHFSNTRMGIFLQLCKIFDKLKSGEEITEDDLDVTRGHQCCPKCGMIYPDQERKVCPKCMDKKSILFRIIGYFKPYKLQLAVMMLCYLATSVLNLVWPYLSGTVLYDRVLAKDEDFLALINLPAGRFTTALILLVITMVLTKITIQAVGILQGVITARISPTVVATIKAQAFDAMGRLSTSFFSKRSTGAMMTRVSDDAEEISSFFVDGFPYFFINVGTMAATCIIMFVLNPLLALITVALMPLLFFISWRMMPNLWHYYGKRHRANRRLNSQINENFTGARVVKAFGQEEQELKRFDKNNRRVQDSELDVARYDNKFYALYNSVENTIIFLVWAVGGALIISQSNMQLGLLITFASYASQLQGPLEFMSRIFRWYTNCMNSAQRLFEIIDSVPEVKESPDPVRPDTLRGEIELKNVTFGYEANKPVLKNISFHVEAGEVFGIVGRSGAGKSTLVNLISRLYDANEGTVLVDGIDVKRYGFQELRKNVAMVSQETYIFMGTVAQNIAYARPDATRAEIIRAAIQANAHDFICKMPEGYDTVLGSSSRSLSGGEKQRISIARAILADPKILILDEATSAVDTETELAIQRSIEQLEKGRTVLSIAHRLSTLRNATHLIVIDDGRIAESGTHEELLAKKGTYYKLYELQTRALAMRGIE